MDAQAHDGHTHHDGVISHRRPGTSTGFWEVNTASHVDWPQQSRLIDVMDNGSGTLSIFGTILDTAAPITPPKAGTSAAGMTDAQLASVSRVLAANDPQTIAVIRGRAEPLGIELVDFSKRAVAKAPSA